MRRWGCPLRAALSGATAPLKAPEMGAAASVRFRTEEHAHVHRVASEAAALRKAPPVAGLGAAAMQAAIRRKTCAICGRSAGRRAEIFV